MAEREPGLYLFSWCLLSKHGFNDGDVPDYVWEWFDEADMLPVDWHTRLVRLVRRYLEPVLDQDVELTEIGTSHNPIRARTVDGVEVDWYAEEQPITLTPEYVWVSKADVLDVVVGEVVSNHR